MKGIIDIEIPIWDAGKKKSVPIENFASYFQSLKAAGWEYVASEGGREGDANYLARYFKGYVNYNCDQCGLWKNMHLQSGTVMNSWESFYPKEWQYIQQGAKDSTALGKKNGILAGVWGSSKGVDCNPILTNSKNGGSPSYQSMVDWSYSNGVGFTHFHVWFSINSNGLASYKSLGFEQIVSELQKTYPATTTASSAASKTVTPTTKATATPTTTATVKEVSTVKATTQPTKTAPINKATATPTQMTAAKEVIRTTSGSDVLRNSSVLELSVPSAQIDNSSDLSPQPILEFSLLGIGVPLAIAGAIYMFMGNWAKEEPLVHLIVRVSHKLSMLVGPPTQIGHTVHKEHVHKRIT